MRRHVFIVGSKGIPSAYGGYETFVDKLTEYHQHHSGLQYHVACKSKEIGEFFHHGARCFRVRTPNIGPAQAIFYDVAALANCCAYIRRQRIQNAVVYILACRVGPFAAYFQKKIHQLGGKLYVNPDGHEWMRAKWSRPVRAYWKFSERLMVKHADLLICDSRNIERYIREDYRQYHPATLFIAYGAETRRSTLDDHAPLFLNWCREKGVSPHSYYLMVGRFVPENNYEAAIREFMGSWSKMDLVLITNADEKALKSLRARTGFDRDPRVKFVGTVYDQELLMKVRESAYGYLHGHEVGGTNPSLLEALSSTRLNLLLDVPFNREVAEEGAVYWTKTPGSLKGLLEQWEGADESSLVALGERAKGRIRDCYNWEHITGQYERAFLRDPNTLRELEN